MLKDIEDNGVISSKVKDELECCICYGFVLDTADECNRCSKLFCKKCQSSGGLQYCPTCRTG